MSREFCRDVPDARGCSKSLCKKSSCAFFVPHPDLLFLVFLRKGKENHQKTRIFRLFRTPKILEKEGEKHSKKQGIPRKAKKQGNPNKLHFKSKEKKIRVDYSAILSLFRLSFRLLGPSRPRGPGTHFGLV